MDELSDEVSALSAPSGIVRRWADHGQISDAVSSSAMPLTD